MHATLHVDLSALRSNYRLLKDRHAKHQLAAVVKANGYGLGVEGVSQAFWEEGCREFFVATLEEGIELRRILPEASIGIFGGLLAGEEKEYGAHRLTPVLNNAEQVERFMHWPVVSSQWPVILHIDTGMTRLGLSENDLKKILPWPLATDHRPLLMSHLACADTPSHAKNAEQLSRFKAALKLFPGARASLANSAALFLSPDFHFDLARPGCALYGINPLTVPPPVGGRLGGGQAETPEPTSPHPNPPPTGEGIKHVATLSAPLLQIRTLDRDETVGYDASYEAKKGSRLAIAGIGYADGYFRSLSNKGFAFIGGHKVPIVGRISMDMLALDVTSIPESRLAPSARAEFINKQQTVDDVAKACGTIGYEIFTRIGRRVKRVYA